ncbi:hypothetical protein [Nocardioides pocheonensis]|uniref:GNAT family N-acetyltransferase n=1 Tax=Nocardioides pocheonensis TaxID=661485 RepID=A0A3N0GHZ2_9ACTN|nr:hypothetical protein [Nocardioides pocheonensis]RNM12103.1 hypothetical protein EFL26_20030 [Nocardioides pocheonensis]
MSEADLSALDLPGFTIIERFGGPRTAKLAVRLGGNLHAVVEVARCRSSRLRDAYPVGEHDVEVVTTGDLPPDATTALLKAVVQAVEKADPFCRRLVTATDADDLDSLHSAEAAGFRYVLKVDLREGTFNLAVVEPSWVTAVDMDLDHMPGT